jgi:hypothetical protein
VPITRLTRFVADPSDAEEMVRRRAALIAAVRKRHGGPTEARLTRLDDQHWVDVWQWDSRERLDAAQAGAPAMAEARAAFAITRDLTTEVGDLVDER